MTQTATQAPASTDVVRIEGLHFSYGARASGAGGRGDHVAVRDVDLDVRPGEVFALLGTNGAGKTTTLDLLQGMLRPAAGTVRVFGLDPVVAGTAVRRRTGAMLQQGGFLTELTVRETLLMWSALSSRSDDVDARLAAVDLAHRRDVRVDRLSGGERRRLDVATATWGRPDLVVLDEPTAGLDPESRRTLWGLVSQLRAGGSAVVLTTHHLEEVEELGDRVAIMHDGEIAVRGTLTEVLATRPARITAELDAAVVPPAVPGLLVGPDVGGRRGLSIECHDLQDTTYQLLGWAAVHGVRLHRMRATSASLEDVFHAVRQESQR